MQEVINGQVNPQVWQDGKLQKELLKVSPYKQQIHLAEESE